MNHVRVVLGLTATALAQTDIPTNVRPPGGSTVTRTAPREGPTPRLPDGTPDNNRCVMGNCTPADVQPSASR